MDEDEVVLILGQAAIGSLDESGWTELGYLTGTSNYLDNHPRLFRSMRFDDPDYGSCAFETIKHMVRASPKNLPKMLGYVPLRKWLEENDPAKLKKFGGRSRRGDATIIDASASASLEDSTTPLYVQHEQIGSGAFGTVYRATRRTAVGEFTFALKVLDPSPFISNLARAKVRFSREVALLQKLQHRAIVAYLDAGYDDQERPYLVMPLVSGKDLRTSCGLLEPKARLRLFDEVLGGLHHAHSNSVLHRDLKPSNIRVRASDQQPIILDFGSAYLLDAANPSTLTTTQVGSLGYIPLEVQADPTIRSPLQDIYACGVMLYEILAGHRPDASDYQSLGIVDESLKKLDGVIEACLATKSSRTGTIKELRKQLRSAGTGLDSAF